MTCPQFHNACYYCITFFKFQKIITVVKRKMCTTQTEPMHKTIDNLCQKHIGNSEFVGFSSNSIRYLVIWPLMPNFISLNRFKPINLWVR